MKKSMKSNIDINPAWACLVLTLKHYATSLIKPSMMYSTVSSVQLLYKEAVSGSSCHHWFTAFQEFELFESRIWFKYRIKNLLYLYL